MLGFSFLYQSNTMSIIFFLVFFEGKAIKRNTESTSNQKKAFVSVKVKNVKLLSCYDSSCLHVHYGRSKKYFKPPNDPINKSM